MRETKWRKSERDQPRKKRQIYRVSAVLTAVGGVEVIDDFLQVLHHPLQLGVNVLCQLVPGEKISKSKSRCLKYRFPTPKTP